VSIFIRLTSHGFWRVNEPSSRLQFGALVETKKAFEPGTGCRIPGRLAFAAGIGYHQHFVEIGEL
jgi:hypothetical protein